MGLTKESVQLQFINRFKHFLKTYKNKGEKVYITRINQMARKGSKSLELNYIDLANELPIFSVWLVNSPKKILEIFQKASSLVFEELYSNNPHLTPEIYVRVINIPITDSLREIRHIQLDKLVCVTGVVIRRSAIFPQLLMVKFDCSKCCYHIGPLIANDIENELKPLVCPNCQSKGPFILNEQETLYRNYQKLNLQEKPNDLIAGNLPRSKEIIVLNDLIDLARPGEEIEVTGIYSCIYDASLYTKNCFPVFNTIIEANYIKKKGKEFCGHHLSYDDRVEILKLSHQPEIIKIISQSIAPFIYGHEYVKTVIALALFGGQEKSKGIRRIRGDINVLLVGDPGMGKSQFLKFIEKTADRVIYTTGKGASAVGLTASVQKNPITQEWTLEGGALVMADRGVCLIDEFDKMNDKDRVSIHERWSSNL